jgi:hypothetical protein
VKAYGRSARGSDLWLEARQVQAALDDPSRSRLVVVDHIRTPSVQECRELFTINVDESRSAREKHCFEVPFSTAVYDSLLRSVKTKPNRSSMPPAPNALPRKLRRPHGRG